ncbi:MAG: rcc01693 family protein [Pseudomonadota bacterium]
MTGFDWPALMRAGIGDMGLRPHEFWRLTPAEFLLITGIAAGPAPLNRAGLSDLLTRFPDTPNGEDT